MSSYLVSPEQIGLLAAYAAKEDVVLSAWRCTYRIDSAKSVAAGLAKANIASVAARYPNDRDGERPGSCLTDAKLIEAAALWAEHYLTTRIPGPIVIAKLVNCLGYQSSDVDDWDTTDAKRQLEWITNDIIRSLPGYEKAEWEWTDSCAAIDSQVYGVAA